MYLYFRPYSSWFFKCNCLLTFFAKLILTDIPRIHVVMIARTSIISESKVSIAVLCLLCSPRYSAVRIKNCLKSMSVIKVATARNRIVPRAPQLSSETEVSIALLSQLCFDLLHSSTNQEVFEKHLCIKSSHYEKYGRFSRYAKEAITCNHQINAFHCQQRWMEYKGGHW